MKKCEECHQKIDVHKGEYVNVYREAWDMHTYHLSCYAVLILESYHISKKEPSRVRTNATPPENGTQRTLEDIFLGQNSQKGNATDHKGNTIEKYPILLTPEAKISFLFSQKGNTKRETLVWGCPQ